MKTAHYFVGRFSVKYVVFGVDGVYKIEAQRYEVKGKLAAKALAKEHNAKPWNF